MDLRKKSPPSAEDVKKICPVLCNSRVVKEVVMLVEGIYYYSTILFGGFKTVDVVANLPCPLCM